MQRGTQVQIIGVIGMVLCLVLAAPLAVALSASAGRHHLGYADTAEESDPPQVALGIAMGAFRGLFVNFLWMRANQLKEDGRYYEAIDLSGAITKLQPRFPRVWVFHAWNMAYNISVATKTQEERWQWVRSGIRLLRNEGIPANPNDLLLHKELAWIYLHKIQGFTDDSNRYYKQSLAHEWQIVLGPPPQSDPLDRSREHAIQRFVDWLTPIAEAPARLKDVIAAEPSVEVLIRRLRDEVGIAELDLFFLSGYETHQAIRRSGRRTLMLNQMEEQRNVAMAALLEDSTLTPAWDALVPFVRRRLLIGEYNMQPYRMIRYIKKYGPIDFRHPAGHAIYWAARGVEEALEVVTDETTKDFDFVNTDRMVVQGIQELMRSGEVYFSFLTQEQITMPNPHFVQTYGDIIDEVYERSRFDVKRRVYSTYAAGYENFMKDAIRFFYRRGQVELAESYRTDLRNWEGQNLNDPDRNLMLSLPLDDWIRQELFDRYESPSVAMGEIVASLQGAFVSGLLGGDQDLFYKQIEYAKQFHRYYMEKQYRINVLGQTGRTEQFPTDFALYAGTVFVQILSTLDPDDVEIMYDRAPDDLKRYAYDAIQYRFREQLDAETGETGGRPFDEVFQEPPGMDVFRAEMQRKMEADRLRRPNVAPQ